MNKSIAPKWKFVSGRLCLDFINTVDTRLEQKVRNSTAFTFRTDKLNSYTDLVEWAKVAGILDDVDKNRLVRMASQDVRKADRVFAKAIALRESLFRVFKYIIEKWEPSSTDIEILNRECAIARNRQKLIYSSNKFTWNLEADEVELDSIIWLIALSSAELLSSKELARVRQCPGINCGWLFLDSSKNLSRQWCDMKDCGNLAKVRRYRERQN
jgi:predicted RNA-binding Zn ribbon-like protein